MTSDEHILSKQPIVPKRNKSNPTLLSKELKTANNFIHKLKNVKNALRLLTCEFDEQLLQLPGLLGALTPKLETGWQSFSLGPGSTATDQLANDLTSQLPPLIRPLQPGQQGSAGSVPLSHSFTWTRLQPRLECNETPNGDEITESRESNLVLEPFVEPEVLLLLTADQIKGLTRTTVNRNRTQASTLTSFGTCIKQLNRPVTCILFTGAKLRTSEKKRTSGVGASTSLSINELCSDLQIRWGVRATRICSTVHDVALVLASYHRSIGERPFKEGRLSRDEGLTFLPDTVRKGLAGCASRGRGAGPAPNISGDDPDGTDSLAVHSWANRLWLAQLGQWRGLTGEVAHAIAQVYPTAFNFFQACQKDLETVDATNSDGSQISGKRRHPLEANLAELEIRRGAGILSSRRRLGPEFARRLVTHFTSEDPSEVIG